MVEPRKNACEHYSFSVASGDGRWTGAACLAGRTLCSVFQRLQFLWTGASGTAASAVERCLSPTCDSGVRKFCSMRVVIPEFHEGSALLAGVYLGFANAS